MEYASQYRSCAHAIGTVGQRSRSTFSVDEREGVERRGGGMAAPPQHPSTSNDGVKKNKAFYRERGVIEREARRRGAREPGQTQRPRERTERSKRRGVGSHLPAPEPPRTTERTRRFSGFAADGPEPSSRRAAQRA